MVLGLTTAFIAAAFTFRSASKKNSYLTLNSHAKNRETVSSVSRHVSLLVVPSDSL